MSFKLPTQQQLDNFTAAVLQDENIWPYLTMSKSRSEVIIWKTDWEGLMLISHDEKTLLKVQFDRQRDCDFNISLYSSSPHQAGQCVALVKELIKRYRPFSINSVVHSSNEKSLKFHKKIYGEPWGIEKLSAWNMKTGAYEDAHWFRMVL